MHVLERRREGDSCTADGSDGNTFVLSAVEETRGEDDLIANCPA